MITTPVILEDVLLGEYWIWLTNAFFLTNTAFQPLLGQLADMFGPHWTTLKVIAQFVIGSGICGGVNNDMILK